MWCWPNIDGNLHTYALIWLSSVHPVLFSQSKINSAQIWLSCDAFPMHKGNSNTTTKWLTHTVKYKIKCEKKKINIYKLQEALSTIFNRTLCFLWRSSSMKVCPRLCLSAHCSICWSTMTLTMMSTLQRRNFTQPLVSLNFSCKHNNESLRSKKKKQKIEFNL